MCHSKQITVSALLEEYRQDPVVVGFLRTQQEYGRLLEEVGGELTGLSSKVLHKAPNEVEGLTENKVFLENSSTQTDFLAVEDGEDKKTLKDLLPKLEWKTESDSLNSICLITQVKLADEKELRLAKLMTFRNCNFKSWQSMRIHAVAEHSWKVGYSDLSGHFCELSAHGSRFGYDNLRLGTFLRTIPRKKPFEEWLPYGDCTDLEMISKRDPIAKREPGEKCRSFYDFCKEVGVQLKAGLNPRKKR